jgi:hypothetical protein
MAVSGATVSAEVLDQPGLARTTVSANGLDQPGASPARATVSPESLDPQDATTDT